MARSTAAYTRWLQQWTHEKDVPKYLNGVRGKAMFVAQSSHGLAVASPWVGPNGYRNSSPRAHGSRGNGLVPLYRSEDTRAQLRGDEPKRIHTSNANDADSWRRVRHRAILLDAPRGKHGVRGGEMHTYWWYSFGNGKETVAKLQGPRSFASTQCPIYLIYSNCF